jgi:hypothetical protein
MTADDFLNYVFEMVSLENKLISVFIPTTQMNSSSGTQLA